MEGGTVGLTHGCLQDNKYYCLRKTTAIHLKLKNPTLEHTGEAERGMGRLRSSQCTDGEYPLGKTTQDGLFQQCLMADP